MISLYKANFISALQLIIGIIDRRPLVPILSHLKLESTPHSLVISGADSHTSISIDISHESEDALSCLVPGHALYDISRRLPTDRRIDITQKENILHITNGVSSFNLITASTDLYPNIERPRLPEGVKLDRSKLISALSKVSHAICPDDSRSAMAGALCEIGDSSITVVATDSFRIALVQYAHKSLYNEPRQPLLTQFTIPKRGVIELAKILKSFNSETVEAFFFPNRVLVRGENASIMLKVLDGIYPDYKSAISIERKAYMKVKSKALEEALDRVTAISQDRARAVSFLLNEDGILLEVHSSGNSASETVEANYVGETIEFTVSSIYILEAIKSLICDVLIFEFGKQFGPIIIRPDGSDMDCTNAVMPMRLTREEMRT